MEGIILNHVEIPVKKQDTQIFKDMNSFQDIKAQYHTRYIVEHFRFF